MATSHQSRWNVSLGVAENSLMHAELAEYIKASFQLPQNALTYGNGGAGSRHVRDAFYSFRNRYFHPLIPIEPDHICVTYGVSTAVENLSCLLADPGDGFLLGQPYFGGFISSIAQTASVPFGQVDPLSVAAVGIYEGVILQCRVRSQKVAGLVI